MDVYYCDGWFRAKKCAIEILDEARARAAYDRREWHTVLLGSVEAPCCFLEFKPGSVGVEFLDAHRRTFLAYQFQELQRGRLFLSMAVQRYFVGESDEVAHGTCYHFKEDGRVIVQHEDRLKGIVERLENEVDVSVNWEAYPEFGDYASISRIERGGSLGEGGIRLTQQDAP